MGAVWIILGVLVSLVAVGFVFWAFCDEGTIVSLGIAVVLGCIGGYWIYAGTHAIFSREHAKHQAILRDLTAQGIRVRDDDVHVGYGGLLAGSEAEVRAGRCVFPLIATKIRGTWYATLPASADDHDRVVLTARAVARLARVCR